MKRILFTLFISAAMISSSCRRGLDYEDVGEPLVLSATNTDYSDSSMVASRAGGLEVDTSTNAQSAQAAHLEQLGEMQALWGSTTRGASKSASRATEAGFQSGDQIGVYIHTTTSVDIANTHTANMRYSTTDKGVTWRTSNALTGALTASSYYVTSYYPHQASLVDPRSVPHVVLADQSAAEGSAEGNLEKSDFMSNAGVAVTDPKGLPKASLVFAHRMSKFRINLIVPSTIDGLAVTGVKSASIKALRNTSTINLATGVVSVTGSAVAIKPRLISGTGAVGTTNRYEAVVVPQNVTGASLVEFICTTASGDRPLSYVVPATGTVSFRSGERLTLTLVSSADVAFLGELDLLDGLAKTAQPLTIKAPLGEAWTLTSPASWLTVSATASGVYGATVSGTGTGDVQTVYVKVVANDKAVADVWAPREALLSLKSGAAATAKTTTYLAVQGYNRFEISTQSAITLISDTPVMLPEVASNQTWKLKGTIPSWLKITTAPVKWAAANSGNTITIPAAGYEVVGSTTLYAVADPATLSRLGGTLANGTTAATVKLTYDETEVNIYWTHSFGHNGTVWSSGNLVSANETAASTAAQGGARIGAMYDGGLYFKFGSLVGLKGGANGSGVGTAVDTHDKLYWLRPTGHTASTEWSNSAYFNDASKTKGDLRDYVTKDNDANGGVGDACRYYLGSPWRLPTEAEYGNLANKQYAIGTNVIWGGSGGKETKTPTTTLYGGWWNGTSSSTTALLTATYFVGSGHRDYADGALGNVGTQGGYWSSSISSATNGLNLNFSAGYVEPQGNYNRLYGFPLRCVQGINIAMEIGTHSPVASSAHKVTLRVAGTDGDSWTLAESGAGASSFTPNITSGKFGTNNTIELAVAANTTTAMRTATYTLTSGDRTSTVTIEQAPAYVQIGSLKWATGNLVATNTTAPNTAGAGGARIGAPYDGGLYFRFGSLVGLKGGFGGSGVGQSSSANDTGYWLRPTGHTASTDWASSAYFADNTKTSGDFKDHHPTDNAANDGIGDACRYYLGAPWRMPTTAEFVALYNNKGGLSVNVGWAASGGKETNPTTNPATTLYGGWWSGTSSTAPVFGSAAYFVGSGYMDSATGAISQIYTQGMYWSSYINNATDGMRVAFYAGNVWSQSGANRKHGFPLRCVQQGINITMEAGTHSPVASSAHKATLRVHGVDGDSWTLAESGAGAASFTPNITSGKFGTNNTIEITVVANPTAAMRTVTYTLTSGGLTSALTIEQAPAYVQIGSLKWATGNLVATNATAANTAGVGGARVGSPYDGGLYFKFGSLVGLKGGFDGSGVGTASTAHDKGYWLRPTGHTTSTDWASAACFDDATKTTGDFKDHHPTDNDANDGIGDACRFYLGAPWRLPTGIEYGDLANKQYTIGANIGWAATGGKETRPTTNPATPLYGGWWNGTSSSTTDILTAAYLLGSGYRNSTDGAIAAVDVQGSYWSSSIGNAVDGIRLNLGAGWVAPQLNNLRLAGFPLRCVQGVRIDLAVGTYNPVASSAHTVNLQLTGGAGESWTLAESGAGAASFTPNITSGKFGTNNTIEIAVVANPTAAMRTVSYTLTSGGLTSTVTIEQAPAYVQIGTLKWATGNLVATNATAANTAGQGGARIGSMYDGGLYFRFGSLVGLKGGANGSGVGTAVNTHDTGYWLRPTGNTNTEWSNAAYFTGAQTSGEFNALVEDNATSGVGDACRYYLGAPWRMPTTAEFVALCNNQGAVGENVGWLKTGGKETSVATDPATPLYGGWWDGTAAFTAALASSTYFVGSGYRHPTTGALANVGTQGIYWSSSISSATYGLYLNFLAGYVRPQDSNLRVHGFTLRCVQGVRIDLAVGTYNPVASSAHKVNMSVSGGAAGESWTLAESGAGAASFTPNITSGKFGTNNTIELTVAANTTAAMRTVSYTLTSGGLTSTVTIEQAPAYVQIGTLKWATGNLVATNATAANTAGVGGARVGSPYDGGLYFKFGSLIGLKGGANGSGVGTAVNTHDTGYWLRPTGNTNTDWASAEYFKGSRTSGEFNALVADNATSGVGDACRYYLGSPWRMPTATEFVALCNGQGGISVDIGWSASGGKETGPTTTPATNLYGGWWDGTAAFTAALASSTYFVGSGYRGNTNGALGSVGTQGVYWSSSLSSATFGLTLHFTAGNVYPQGSNQRVHGFTLRCVQ